MDSKSTMLSTPSTRLFTGQTPKNCPMVGVHLSFTLLAKAFLGFFRDDYLAFRIKEATLEDTPKGKNERAYNNLLFNEGFIS